MRLPLPGPGDLLRPVRTLTGAIQVLGSTVATTTTLVPQIEHVVTRIISLLDAAERDAPRVGVLLHEMEKLVGSLGFVSREGRAGTLSGLIDRADALLTSRRSLAAADLLDRFHGLLTDQRVESLNTLLDRAEPLLTPERMEAAARLLDRLDDILTPDRVEAVQALLDRLPVLLTAERTRALSALADQSRRLVTALESGELPASRDLRQMPRDIHVMLELIDDLHQVVTGVPGARNARDRGAEAHRQVSTEKR
ncbi:hypothetical protein [Pseudonocardia nigra]|uniref:hypothetical protein n=1 Tax=Pseudonocardia nigra TaxID=1921578 RepID=UPI001C5CE0CD|nr:hypothetical protein [Pseudonocardia nigra]